MSTEKKNRKLMTLHQVASILEKEHVDISWLGKDALILSMPWKSWEILLRLSKDGKQISYLSGRLLSVQRAKEVRKRLVNKKEFKVSIKAKVIKVPMKSQLHDFLSYGKTNLDTYALINECKYAVAADGKLTHLFLCLEGLAILTFQDFITLLA